jgi:hypothetical protein
MLGNGSVGTWQRINTEIQNYRRTVGHVDLFGSPRSYERVKVHSSFVREFSVQLWSANQRKTEAEEVTDP